MCMFTIGRCYLVVWKVFAGCNYFLVQKFFVGCYLLYGSVYVLYWCKEYILTPWTQVFCVTADLQNPETFTRPWFSKAKLQMNIDFINIARLKHFTDVLKEIHFLASLWKVSHLSVSHNKEVILIFIPFSLRFLWIMNFSNSSYPGIAYNYLIRNGY